MITYYDIEVIENYVDNINEIKEKLYFEYMAEENTINRVEPIIINENIENIIYQDELIHNSKDYIKEKELISIKNNKNIIYSLLLLGTSLISMNLN